MKLHLRSTIVLLFLLTLAQIFSLQAFSLSRFFGRNGKTDNKPHLTQLQSFGAKVNTNYVEERNQLLLNQIINSTRTSDERANLTELILPWMNFYDDSFDHYLSQQISLSTEKDAKDFFGKIRYEINIQRQQQLLKAQELFKAIISINDIKDMEAKLLYHLTRNEIQLPFLMILEMNLENAVINKGSENVIELLTYLRSFIMEYQDKLVNPPVKLLRQLLRFEGSNEMRNLLSKKILFQSSSQSRTIPQTKSSPDQCEFIVTSASLQDEVLVPDVTVPELEDAIAMVEQQLEELLMRVSEGGGSQEEIDSALDLQTKCQLIRIELNDLSSSS